MTLRIFFLIFHLTIGLAITFPFTPILHAQQGEGDSREKWRLHRPDNQAKQKESISGGACIVQTGAFPVGFNAYVVPDGDHPSYPPFCSPVPAGALNLVIDLLAPEIRELPLMVKLMKVEAGEEREILSIPAVEYTSGNIPMAVNLEPLAKYNVLLIGNNGAGSSDLVTIPLEVRKAGDFVHTGNGGTGWGFLVLVVALAAMAGGVIHFCHPKSAASSISKTG